MNVPMDRSINRVRHETRRRALTVTSVEDITPSRRRITLGGPELDGFTSAGFDDHVKVIVDPGDGEGRQATMRDYTPHHFDPAAGTFQIDFVMHDAGPVTDWARHARAGDNVIIGGPRGSFIVGTGFDWHLLIGDETALPAIERRLSELPEGARALIIAEVGLPEHEPDLTSRAQINLHWVRSWPGALLAAVREVAFPSGDYHAWVACETSDAKAIRAALIERGADPQRLRAAGYWRRGGEGVHEILL